MKRLAALAATTLAALALAACGAPDHGVITGKDYHAPYTYFQQVCYSYNSTGTCKMYIPTPVNVPAHYYLKLQNGNDSGSREVDQHTYETARVGDSF